VTRVGLMLYSVREESAADFEGTLRAVAAFGYEGVELFDLHGHDAGVVRGWLDELGLAVAGRHTLLDALETRLPELAAEAGSLGSNRLVVGWIEPPTNVEAAAAALDRIGSAARAAAALGLQLGFHNHDAEVRPLGDGRTFLERLLELPVFLELDLGWAWWAGVDPAGLLDATLGRVPLVHVKDFRTRGERSFCRVGDGNVGYDHVAPAAEAAGAEWLIVEQDESDGSAVEDAGRSLATLRSLLVAA